MPAVRGGGQSGNVSGQQTGGHQPPTPPAASCVTCLGRGHDWTECTYKCAHCRDNHCPGARCPVAEDTGRYPPDERYPPVERPTITEAQHRDQLEIRHEILRDLEVGNARRQARINLLEYVLESNGYNPKDPLDGLPLHVQARMLAEGFRSSRRTATTPSGGPTDTGRPGSPASGVVAAAASGAGRLDPPAKDKKDASERIDLMDLVVPGFTEVFDPKGLTGKARTNAKKAFKKRKYAAAKALKMKEIEDVDEDEDEESGVRMAWEVAGGESPGVANTSDLDKIYYSDEEPEVAGDQSSAMDIGEPPIFPPSSAE